jgi:hypothetical protein
MKITAIIKVEDTRQYEEIADDVWVAIPGSGIENNCFRCNRVHEVHAHVKLENGETKIVGTGCMHADDTVAASTIKSATSRAKTIAKLNAKIAAEKANDQKVSDAWTAVKAMAIPEITEATSETGRFRLYCGDAYQYCDKRTPDYEKQVQYSWQHNRVAEMLKPHGLSVFRGSKLYDLEKRLARMQKGAA